MVKKILLSTLFSGIVLAGCTSTQPQTTTEPSSDEATESQQTEVLEQQTTGAEENGDTAMMEKDGQYTLAEVEQHATGEDCWMAVEGKVYDVTKFIASGKHGGGDAILFGCGKDATEMYNNRGEKKEPHSATARALLDGFEIGTLVESK